MFCQKHNHPHVACKLAVLWFWKWKGLTMQVFFAQSKDSNKTTELCCPKKGQTYSTVPCQASSFIYWKYYCWKQNMHQHVKHMLLNSLAGITDILLKSFWGVNNRTSRGVTTGWHPDPRKSWAEYLCDLLQLIHRGGPYENGLSPIEAHQACNLPDERQGKSWGAIVSHNI